MCHQWILRFWLLVTWLSIFKSMYSNFFYKIRYSLTCNAVLKFNFIKHYSSFKWCFFLEVLGWYLFSLFPSDRLMVDVANVCAGYGEPNNEHPSVVVFIVFYNFYPIRRCQVPIFCDRVIKLFLQPCWLACFVDPEGGSNSMTVFVLLLPHWSALKLCILFICVWVLLYVSGFGPKKIKCRWLDLSWRPIYETLIYLLATSTHCDDYDFIVVEHCKINITEFRSMQNLNWISDISLVFSHHFLYIKKYTLLFCRKRIIKA